MIYLLDSSITKFGNCRSVTMYISENYGAEKTHVHFIGLKGEFTPIKRQAVLATYELVPAAYKEGTKNEVPGSYPVS